MSHAWRRRNAQALYDQHYGPNMTPMVDVVMVILIFFMASTAFLGPEWFLKTHIPTKTAGPSSAPQPLRVLLRMSPEMHTTASLGVLTGLTMEQLETRLGEAVAQQGAETMVVMIDPGAEVPYDDVVRVHEVCTRLGITKMGLVEGAKP